ncbi:MAG: CDP-alcohol phosphatidyltransferase family protein [Gemmatimonadota bacterium]
MRLLLWCVTLARLVAIPVFVVLASEAQEMARSALDPTVLRWGAIGVMLSIGVSDLLDGWIARRHDLETQLGATVDAVADKLAQVAFVAYLTLDVGPVFTAIPLWFLITVFGRDLTLLVGVSVLRLRYGPLRVVHRTHGRVATMLIVAVILWSAFGLPAAGMTPLAVVTAGLSAWSATIYALDGAAQGNAIRAREEAR